jgi:hypothetical protein
MSARIDVALATAQLRERLGRTEIGHWHAALDNTLRRAALATRDDAELGAVTRALLDVLREELHAQADGARGEQR